MCLYFIFMFPSHSHTDIFEDMFETFIPDLDYNVTYFKIINKHYLEKSKVDFVLFQLEKKIEI